MLVSNLSWRFTQDQFLCFGPESYKSGKRCRCHMFDGFKVPIKRQVGSAPFKEE